MTTQYTIKEIVAKYNLSNVYVRRMIQQGKLITTKVPVIGMKNTFKHVVDEEELVRWRSSSQHNKREDGRNRFILYATSEEKATLDELLKESELGVIVIRQNNVKNVESDEE